MNPTGAPNFGSAPGGAGPMDVNGIKEQLNVPSLLLLIGSIGGILLDMGSMVRSLVMGNELPAQFMNDPNLRQFAPMFQTMQKTGPIVTLVAIAACGFIAFGAMKMRNLQSYTVAMTACIFGIIPCCQSCCCIITIVGGIWGLVVLMKPEVKAAFTA